MDFMVEKAIWMLPTDSSYGQWPRSGEIDIVEVRGNQDFKCGGTQFGRQLAGSTLHWVYLFNHKFLYIT